MSAPTRDLPVASAPLVKTEKHSCAPYGMGEQGSWLRYEQGRETAAPEPLSRGLTLLSQPRAEAALQDRGHC